MAAATAALVQVLRVGPVRFSFGVRGLRKACTELPQIASDSKRSSAEILQVSLKTKIRLQRRRVAVSEPGAEDGRWAGDGGG
jgi:hypothetical protein